MPFDSTVNRLDQIIQNRRSDKALRVIDRLILYYAKDPEPTETHSLKQLFNVFFLTNEIRDLETGNYLIIREALLVSKGIL